MTTSQENVRAPGNSVVPQVSITDASRAKCTECRGAGFADGGSGAAYWKETCHMCEGTGSADAGSQGEHICGNTRCNVRHELCRV